jgi:hypothetical protein
MLEYQEFSKVKFIVSILHLKFIDS